MASRLLLHPGGPPGSLTSASTPSRLAGALTHPARPGFCPAGCHTQCTQSSLRAALPLTHPGWEHRDSAILQGGADGFIIRRANEFQAQVAAQEGLGSRPSRALLTVKEKCCRGCAAGGLSGGPPGGPGLGSRAAWQRQLPALKPEEGAAGTQPSSPGAFSWLPALLGRTNGGERERRDLSTPRPRRGRPLRPSHGHPSLAGAGLL